MRMWMLSPEAMCRRHLLGEHSEIHKFRHVFVKGWGLSGRLYPIVQIVPNAMAIRHDELVRYLNNHQSPYVQPDLSEYPADLLKVTVNLEYNIRDLSHRCPECRVKIERYYGPITKE